MLLLVSELPSFLSPSAVSMNISHFVLDRSHFLPFVCNAAMNIGVQITF